VSNIKTTIANTKENIDLNGLPDALSRCYIESLV